MKSTVYIQNMFLVIKKRLSLAVQVNPFDSVEGFAVTENIIINIE